jgi:hypothetical protein
MERMGSAIKNMIDHIGEKLTPWSGASWYGNLKIAPQSRSHHDASQRG